MTRMGRENFKIHFLSVLSASSAVKFFPAAKSTPRQVVDVADAGFIAETVCPRQAGQHPSGTDLKKRGGPGGPQLLPCTSASGQARPGSVRPTAGFFRDRFPPRR